MTDYFEQRAMKSLRRLQKMRNTAMSKSQDSETAEAVQYWQGQYFALEQAISILIDPDQLTLWSENQ